MAKILAKRRTYGADATFLLAVRRRTVVIFQLPFYDPIEYHFPYNGFSTAHNVNLATLAVRIRKASSSSNASIAGRSPMSMSITIMRHQRFCAVVFSRPTKRFLVAAGLTVVFVDWS